MASVEPLYKEYRYADAPAHRHQPLGFDAFDQRLMRSRQIAAVDHPRSDIRVGTRRHRRNQQQ